MLLTGAALMLAGLVLAGGAETRRRGGPGLAALGLGIAADRHLVGAGTSPSLDFAALNAGLLLAGAVVVAVALGRAVRRPGDPLAAVGIAAGALGFAVALAAILALALPGGAGVALGAALALGLAGAGTGWLGRRTGWGAELRSRAALPPALAPAPVPLLLLALGAATAVLASHIGIVLGGGVVCAWGGWLSIPAAQRPWPAAPVLVLVALGIAFWLLATIAGPEGLAIGAIPALPLSPAAELLVAPLLLAAAWALSGSWPLRMPLGGALTAPVGAVLLVRLALPLAPGGLEHWRAAAFPVVLAGLWHAAVTRRLVPLAVGGALLGLVSGAPGGIVGAGWLLATAPAIELAGRARRADRPALRLVHALLALAAGWGALLVLEAGLGAEVVYTAAAAALVALAVAPAPALTPPRGRSIFPAR